MWQVSHEPLDLRGTKDTSDVSGMFDPAGAANEATGKV